MSHEDGFKEKRKISAAWAVDEDISRLLKSLPNWIAVSSYEGTTSSMSTPSAVSPTSESESDVCYRNERESEILIGKLSYSASVTHRHIREYHQFAVQNFVFIGIQVGYVLGNLGTAKHLVRDELVTDVEVIRSLACMHESLKWFCNSMCLLIEQLPESSRNVMRKCVVQLQRTDESGIVHQSVSDILVCL